MAAMNLGRREAVRSIATAAALFWFGSDNG